MRDLGACLAMEAEAAEAVARIEAEIASEEAGAAGLDGSDLVVEAFGRWLRRARDRRQAATEAGTRATAETARARAVLGAARAALAAAEGEQARRAEAATAAALRVEQASIDEHAGRRSG